MFFNATKMYHKLSKKEFADSKRTQKWISQNFKKALKKHFQKAKSTDVRRLRIFVLPEDNYGRSMLKVKDEKEAIIYKCSADFELTIRCIILKWYTEDYDNSFIIKL